MPASGPCLRQTPWGWTLIVLTVPSVALASDVNYDEEKVPAYTLPDPLRTRNGQPVRTVQQWSQRRAEIRELFATHVYGRVPARAEACWNARRRDSTNWYEVIESQEDAWNGTAHRKQISLRFVDQPDTPRLDVLMYLPADGPRPCPLMLGLNFYGNQSVNHDPAIRISDRWMRNNADKGVVDNRATEASRGSSASRWSIDAMLRRGYGVVTAYYGDIDPDYDDGFQNGIHPLYYSADQKRPAADQWGSIAAWAWGLSRILDYLEQDPDVDARRVAVMGHSRLGKTALWAGAVDTRFALVISNNSGCGGAALSRRRYGETVRRINEVFPHWFCENFKRYNDREDALPVDQHMLLALIAPRPVFVASAQQDRWADPRGEFLACRGADPVYRLWGTDGCAADQLPPLDKAIMSTIGYRLRRGKHDVLPSDWQVFADFADKHMR